jgi:hypothetical protein
MGGPVDFIYQDEVRAVQKERGTISVAFDEVDAGHEVAKVLEDAAVGRGLVFEPGDGAGTDDDGIEVKFFGQFLLPLFTEIRGAEDGESAGVTPVEEFPGDESAFDGFADAHVVRDEEACRGKAERHEERDKLIRPGPGISPHLGPLAQRSPRPA